MKKVSDLVLDSPQNDADLTSEDLKQWWIDAVKELKEMYDELCELEKADKTYRDAALNTYILMEWLKNIFPLTGKDLYEREKT